MRHLYPLTLFLPIPDMELLVSDVKEKLMMSCQHGAVLIGLHHGECRQGTQLDASTTFVGRQFHRANFAFLLKENEFGRRIDGKGFVASSFQAKEFAAFPARRGFDIAYDFGRIREILGNHFLVIFGMTE